VLYTLSGGLAWLLNNRGAVVNAHARQNGYTAEWDDRGNYFRKYHSIFVSDSLDGDHAIDR